MEVNKENLEDALNDGQQPQISKEEEIGYHKGSLSTLINERNELIRMAQVVESLMQAHMKRLEELGVKIQQQKK